MRARPGTPEESEIGRGCSTLELGQSLAATGWQLRLGLGPGLTRTQSDSESRSFLESTFTDQNNPKRQTADPQWSSPKLDRFHAESDSEPLATLTLKSTRQWQR